MAVLAVLQAPHLVFGPSPPGTGGALHVDGADGAGWSSLEDGFFDLAIGAYEQARGVWVCLAQIQGLLQSHIDLQLACLPNSLKGNVEAKLDQTTLCLKALQILALAVHDGLSQLCDVPRGFLEAYVLEFVNEYGRMLRGVFDLPQRGLHPDPFLKDYQPRSVEEEVELVSVWDDHVDFSVVCWYSQKDCRARQLVLEWSHHVV